MFKLTETERVHNWHLFRKSLDNLPLNIALSKVVQYWDHCPFSPYYLDVEDVANWPNPWTLIAENWYCDVAKALAMLYTIKYTKHNPDVELRIYHDESSHYDYNVAWIENGTYILNLEQHEISNAASIEPTWVLKYCFKSDELKLDNY